MPDEADVYAVGNSHTYLEHKFWFQQFVNRFGEDGDVVLVAGKPAGFEYDRSELFKTQWITKNVSVIGWDNIVLRDQALKLGRQFYQLLDRLRKPDLSAEEGERLALKMEHIHCEFLRIGVFERNESLVETLFDVRQRCPDARIFIDAGTLHFSYGDSYLMAFLENEDYIALGAMKDGLDPYVTTREYIEGTPPCFSKNQRCTPKSSSSCRWREAVVP